LIAHQKARVCVVQSELPRRACCMRMNEMRVCCMRMNEMRVCRDALFVLVNSLLV